MHIHSSFSIQDPTSRAPTIQIIINKEDSQSKRLGTTDTILEQDSIVHRSDLENILQQDSTVYHGDLKNILEQNSTSHLGDSATDTIKKPMQLDCRPENTSWLVGDDIKEKTLNHYEEFLKKEVEWDLKLLNSREEDEHIVNFISAEDKDLLKIKGKKIKPLQINSIEKPELLPTSNYISLVAPFEREVRSPCDKVFLDLSSGLNQLKSQISRLCENRHNNGTLVTPKTSSPINSSGQDLEDYSISPIKYSSPDKTNAQTDTVYTAQTNDMHHTDSSQRGRTKGANKGNGHYSKRSNGRTY